MNKIHPFLKKLFSNWLNERPDLNFKNYIRSVYLQDLGKDYFYELAKYCKMSPNFLRGQIALLQDLRYWIRNNYVFCNLKFEDQR